MTLAENSALCALSLQTLWHDSIVLLQSPRNGIGRSLKSLPFGAHARIVYAIALGSLFFGARYGSAMIANKFRGIFACVCQDPVCAELARQHNDANVLCIGGKIIGPVLAMAIAKTWMATEPLTAERYASRRRKVADIDKERTVAL